MVSYFDFEEEPLPAFDVHAVELRGDEHGEDFAVGLDGKKAADGGRPLEGLANDGIELVDVAAEAVGVLEVILNGERSERPIGIAGPAEEEVAARERGEHQDHNHEHPDRMSGRTSAASHKEKYGGNEAKGKSLRNQ
jgi:hypothetical protein